MANVQISRATLEMIRRRKGQYQRLFGSPEGKEVLADLNPFCRAETSCWHPDPRTHAALEGRREVWLRIQDHLNKPAEELYVQFGGVIKTKDTPNG